MPEATPTELRAYLNWLLLNIDSLQEEGLLAAYYQLASYEHLVPFLIQHKEEFIQAIHNHDTRLLVGLIRKVESDFTIGLTQEVVQTQAPKERSLPVEPLGDSYSERARTTTEVLGNITSTAEEIRQVRKKGNRAFISQLVQRYSEIPPSQQSTIIEQLVSQSEEHPDVPAAELVRQVVDGVIKDNPAVILKMEKDHELITRTRELQTDTTPFIEKSVVEVIITSPKPRVAFQTIVGGVKAASTSLESVLNRAELVSTAATIIDGSKDAKPDYRGFFTALAENGGATERVLSPIADVIINVFPPGARETIVTSVMSSLWKKETRNGGVFQRTLESVFGSEAVRRIIQRGNSVFHTTSTGHILTPAQSFLGDVITTVFRPSISTVWLEIVRVDSQLLPSKMYQYYLALLAKKGAQQATKEAAKKIGKRAVKTASAKAAGQTIGATLGSALMAIGVPPIIAQFLGGAILGKVFDLVFGFFEKASNFIKGLLNYAGEPWFKDYGTVLGLILLSIIILPVLFPGFISIFPPLGGAGYNQLVTDNAFVRGIGYEGEGGSSINCLAEENKTKPECSMETCDPAKQDCRWPTHGYITQGPMSSCPGTKTSHSGTQAIDIGANLTDVYATIDGIVEDAFWGCPDNTGHWGNQCGGMRGNYVILKGASYTLTFYHLSQIVTPVHTGDRVTANMVIGKVDHTGNSSGPHLHFGYRGPGSINSILPVAIPPCVGRSGPCACPFIETK